MLFLRWSISLLAVMSVVALLMLFQQGWLGEIFSGEARATYVSLYGETYASQIYQGARGLVIALFLLVGFGVIVWFRPFRALT